MCRLCRFAASSSVFSKDIEKTYVEDMDKLLATKKHEPSNPSIFTNLDDWMTFRFNFALFEPLTAVPNPKNYYQPMMVDGAKVRTDWSSGWTRSIGFLPDGSILIYTKATERASFGTEEWFRYFFLLKLEPSALEVTYEPPRFIIRAEDLKLKGTNMLNYMPAEHTFSFTFSHIATDKNVMRAEAVARSEFFKEMKRVGGKAGAEKEGAGQRSDFERYMVTTMHFTPHPLLMKLNMEAGFGSRIEFQNAVPGYLAEHFKELAARSGKKAAAGSEAGNV